MSARAIGLPAEMGVTDSAMLVSKRMIGDKWRTIAPEVEFGIVPHGANRIKKRLEGVCQELGYTYIDPTVSQDQSIGDIIGKIRSCRTIVTESLHGAIVADAFGISWIPAVFYHPVLVFKWNDWCRSLGLHDPFDVVTRARIFLIDQIRRVGKVLGRQWFLASMITHSMLRSTVVKCTQDRLMLSDRVVMKAKTDELVHLLSKIREDYRRGLI